MRKQAPMPKYCFGDYATHTSADGSLDRKLLWHIDTKIGLNANTLHKLQNKKEVAKIAINTLT